MKNKALVSIIVPVYNASKYLKKTLDCIKKQTYKNLEIICVDDGSTDNSLEIIDVFIKNDSRFKVIRQQNLHAGIARNNGFKHSNGDYVLFLDADDLFSKRMVSVFVKTIERKCADIVICSFSTFSDHNSFFVKKQNLKYAGESKSPSEMKDDLFQMTIGAPWNKFYRKSFLDNSGLLFQDTLNSNDIFFTRLTIALASNIVFINDRLIKYRVYNNSSLQGSVNNSASSFALAFLKICDEMKCRGLFKTYKRSLQQYAIDLCFTALDKSNNPKSLRDVFSSCHDVLSAAELTDTSTYEEARRKCLIAIINNDFASFLENYLFLSKSQMVYVSSVEYRIGRNILHFLGIKR